MPRTEILKIPLSGQRDEKTARLARGPSVLRRAVNVDHSRSGELRKRRGYTRIDLSLTTHGQAPELVFQQVGVVDGELVLIGRDAVYGVLAPDESVDGAALVYRGPCMSGNYRIETIHVSSMSS